MRDLFSAFRETEKRVMGVDELYLGQNVKWEEKQHLSQPVTLGFFPCSLKKGCGRHQACHSGYVCIPVVSTLTADISFCNANAWLQLWLPGIHYRYLNKDSAGLLPRYGVGPLWLTEAPLFHRSWLISITDRWGHLSFLFLCFKLFLFLFYNHQ